MSTVRNGEERWWRVGSREVGETVSVRKSVRRGEQGEADAEECAVRYWVMMLVIHEGR